MIISFVARCSLDGDIFNALCTTNFCRRTASLSGKQQVFSYLGGRLQFFSDAGRGDVGSNVNILVCGGEHLWELVEDAGLVVFQVVEHAVPYSWFFSGVDYIFACRTVMPNTKAEIGGAGRGARRGKGQ